MGKQQGGTYRKSQKEREKIENRQRCSNSQCIHPSKSLCQYLECEEITHSFSFSANTIIAKHVRTYEQTHPQACRPTVNSSPPTQTPNHFIESCRGWKHLSSIVLALLRSKSDWTVSSHPDVISVKQIKLMFLPNFYSILFECREHCPTSDINSIILCTSLDRDSPLELLHGYSEWVSRWGQLGLTAHFYFWLTEKTKTYISSKYQTPLLFMLLFIHFFYSVSVVTIFPCRQ